VGWRSGWGALGWCCRGGRVAGAGRSTVTPEAEASGYRCAGVGESGRASRDTPPFRKKARKNGPPGGGRLPSKKQIPFGNDRQKSKGKYRSKDNDKSEKRVLRFAQDDNFYLAFILQPLFVGGEGHYVEVGEAVDPAGGFSGVGVDELDDAAFGVGEAGLHDGDDGLAGGEAGFELGAGEDDEVVVGAGGDYGGMQDEGFGFAGAGEAGFGEDVGDEGAGVLFVGVAVRVVDVDGDLGHLDEVFGSEGGSAAFEGDVERL